MGAATKSSEVEMSSLSVSPRVPRIFLLLLLLAKSSLQAEGSSCNLTLTPDPGSQNVVSTQLEGSWVIDDELTERLWPDFVWKSSNVTYKFENSSEVLDLIPEEYCKFFHDAATEWPIYMAGFFSRRKNEEPWTTFLMVLTTLHGNPHIVYWRYNWADTESFNIILARSSDRSQDMLFVGGDFNNQPFSAWKRL